ncbi:MAG: hypothetical protein IH840_17985, partial [Candidatus Heimdallarchaeota archaeon]|nr:hypothetical protein [Candidatus Heimdallarchaeota archaeon]
MADSIRKNDSLGNEVVRLRNEMKLAHGMYNDYISDLALLTKTEIKSVIKAIDDNNLDNGNLVGILESIEKVENVLFGLEDQKIVMDEIVQVIGGLEFSTDNRVDKLADILKDQERQKARMVTEVNHLRDSYESVKTGDEVNMSDFKGNLREFLESFSRFQ